jgi:hypothetical protein
VSSQHVFWGVFEKPIFKILIVVGGVLLAAKHRPPRSPPAPPPGKRTKGKKDRLRWIRIPDGGRENSAKRRMASLFNLCYTRRVEKGKVIALCLVKKVNLKN